MQCLLLCGHQHDVMMICCSTSSQCNAASFTTRSRIYTPQVCERTSVIFSGCFMTVGKAHKHSLHISTVPCPLCGEQYDNNSMICCPSSRCNAASLKCCIICACQAGGKRTSDTFRAFHHCKDGTEAHPSTSDLHSLLWYCGNQQCNDVIICCTFQPLQCSSWHCIIKVHNLHSGL